MANQWSDMLIYDIRTMNENDFLHIHGTLIEHTPQELRVIKENLTKIIKDINKELKS